MHGLAHLFRQRNAQKYEGRTPVLSLLPTVNS